MRKAAEQASQQVVTPLQTSNDKASNNIDNTAVLRSQGVASWLNANYPKDDYDQRIKDMRRQKAISTLGNIATAVGQAASLGLGARQFDKIQDKSAQYDKYIQKLKDAQLNYNLNRANAMYNAVNADVQRQTAADEADKARQFNAGEADKTRAYNADLARYQAEIDANKRAQQMAFDAYQKEQDRQNRLVTANIRSSGSGSDKYYGSLPVNGETKHFKTKADYEAAVMSEAKRLNIDTNRLTGGLDPDGGGYGSTQHDYKINRIAGELLRRSKGADGAATDVNDIFANQ